MPLNSKLVSTKTLLLKHYYHQKGFRIFFCGPTWGGGCCSFGRVCHLSFAPFQVQVALANCILICTTFFPFLQHALRWAKSRESYRRIASEGYRSDSNH